MKKLFILVRGGETKTIDMKGASKLEVRYFLSIAKTGELRVINAAPTGLVGVYIRGNVNLEGKLVVLRIGEEEKNLRETEPIIEKKPKTQITGYAFRNDGSEFITLDLGPQLSWKEVDKHIAAFGLDV